MNSEYAPIALIAFVVVMVVLVHDRPSRQDIEATQSQPTLAASSSVAPRPPPPAAYPGPLPERGGTVLPEDSRAASSSAAQEAKEALEGVWTDTKDVAGALLDQARETGADIMEEVRNIAGEVADQAQETGAEVLDSVREAGAAAVDQMQETGGKVLEAIQEASATAVDEARETGHELVDAMEGEQSAQQAGGETLETGTGTEDVGQQGAVEHSRHAGEGDVDNRP